MPKPTPTLTYVPGAVSAADAAALERSVARTVDEAYAAGLANADPPRPTVEVSATFDAAQLPNARDMIHRVAVTSYQAGATDRIAQRFGPNAIGDLRRYLRHRYG